MSIQFAELSITVQQLKKDSRRIKFDLTAPRAEEWGTDKCSLLIHSLLSQFPVPPIYVQAKDDSNIWVIKGKQRLNAVLNFVRGKYSLAQDTPAIRGYKIAGMKFSELPEHLQQELLTCTMKFVELRHITDKQRETVLKRLNGGRSDRTKEQTQDNSAFWNSAVSMPVFRNCVIPGKTGASLINLIVECTAIVAEGKPVELGAKVVRQWKKTGVSGKTLEQMEIVTQYMSEAFPYTQKFLNRANVSILFHIASTLALPRRISPTQFGAWAQSFFNSKARSWRYAKACEEKTLLLDNVTKRTRILTKDFEKYIDTVDDVPNNGSTLLEWEGRTVKTSIANPPKDSDQTA